MSRITRVLAAVLAGLLAGQPGFAAVRVAPVQVQTGLGGASASGAAGASLNLPANLNSTSLPAPALGLPQASGLTFSAPAVLPSASQSAAAAPTVFSGHASPTHASAESGRNPAAGTAQNSAFPPIPQASAVAGVSARPSRRAAADSASAGSAADEAASVHASRAGLGKKLQAAAERVSQSAAAIGKGSLESGAGAARRAFGALFASDDATTPSDADFNDESFDRLLEEDLARRARGELPSEASAEFIFQAELPAGAGRARRAAEEANVLLEESVAEAAADVLGAEMRVLSRGSTARGTQAGAASDFDIMVELPSDWTIERAETALGGRVQRLREALVRRIGERLSQPAGEVEVQAGGYVQLSDPVTRQVDRGVFMMPVKVYGADKRLLMDVDVTFTNQPKYVNAYPEYFAAQLAQVREQGGDSAAESVLSDIRIAKLFFQKSVGAYKVWRGGPSGVGVEQMIMQSGEVSHADKGRTILEAGSFDKFISRVLSIAYDENGRERRLRDARARWTVHNPFREPQNFLNHLSPNAWKNLVRAARNYREAALKGEPTTFNALRSRNPGPWIVGGKPLPEAPAAEAAAAPETAAAPEARPAGRIRLRFESGLPISRMKDIFSSAVEKARAQGRVLTTSLRHQRRQKNWTYDAVVIAEDPAQEAALRAVLADSLRPSARGEVTSAESDPAHLLLFIDAHILPRASANKAVQKGIKRLQRSMKGLASVHFSPKALSRGGFLLEARLAPGVSAEIAAQSAAQALREHGRGLVLRGYSAAPKAAQAAPSGVQAQAAAPAALGELTLDMLERFTLTGPKPSERGDAFLHAQGAKALPEGLEGSWPAPRKASKDALRTTLVRRGPGVFVMVPTENAEGEVKTRLEEVPAELAYGIVDQSVVDVEFSGPRPTAVLPVGSYPMDVMIGRVIRRGGALKLAALLNEDGRPLSLYPELPLSGAAEEGEIVQAFVRPAKQGYEAVGLMGLGRELTPAIAAREIALRHGARAYFESSVIAQAEEVGRSLDASGLFEKLRSEVGDKVRLEDLSALPFITIDPVGAGDLDDAYYVEKNEDGSTTWYLATADVGEYVPPGTPAFRNAARIGNTFYSIDKNGVPEFPMNHPVVSKNAASLLAGKDSLAMITKMKFSPTGEFLISESQVYLGKVRVQGRYSYDQVVEMWKGSADHGITHVDQVTMARELAGRLNELDQDRGKLQLSLSEAHHAQKPDGSWTTRLEAKDPLTEESHRLIEELKVYGNRVIAGVLEGITKRTGVPHVSRMHPPQDEEKNARLRRELREIGADWPMEETLPDFLVRLNARKDLSAEAKETAQILALMSRSRAEYGTVDDQGHEGLALGSGLYDHPSAPIRRFSDMYNRALLETELAGGDPRETHRKIVADLQLMGFDGLEDYMRHLNGREAAAKAMDRDVDAFMAVHALAKAEYQNRPLMGYAKLVKGGRNAMVVLQLSEPPVSVVLRGEEAAGFKLLDKVMVTVTGADPAQLKVDFTYQKLGRPNQGGGRRDGGRFEEGGRRGGQARGDRGRDRRDDGRGQQRGRRGKKRR